MTTQYEYHRNLRLRRMSVVLARSQYSRSRFLNCPEDGSVLERVK